MFSSTNTFYTVKIIILLFFSNFNCLYWLNVNNLMQSNRTFKITSNFTISIFKINIHKINYFKNYNTLITTMPPNKKLTKNYTN